MINDVLAEVHPIISEKTKLLSDKIIKTFKPIQKGNGMNNSVIIHPITKKTYTKCAKTYNPIAK